MTDTDCQRWISLSDRRALGETLPAPDAEFQRVHQAACAACAAEAKVWFTLNGVFSDVGAESVPLPAPERAQQRRARVAVAAMGLAVAAAAGAWLLAGSPSHPPAAAPAAQARVALVAVWGEVDVRGVPAAAGAELRSADVVRIGHGGACLSISPAVSACAGEATELAVGDTSVSRHTLALASGLVVSRLEPQAPGTTFGIETPKGSVTAKGTVFAVQVSPTRDVSVRVHEGTVAIRLSDGSEQSLSAPEAAVLGASLQRVAVAAADEARDEVLIARSGLWSDGASCAIELRVAPEGARVTLDGVTLGQAPLSALVARGSRVLSVEQAGYVPVTERLVLVGAERVVRNLELVPVETSAPAPSAMAAAVVGAPELLARARSLRSAGRFAEAASAYERLLATHPGSAEARAALVSLGELQLSQLGDAAGGLRSFEAYLRGGGGLVQEARYGRIRALGRLGRVGEERAESERFVRDYPRSVQAATLRARLGSP